MQSADQVYLSDSQVAARYSVGRCSVWRWARRPDFPKPVKLSPGCTRWRLADLKQWEAERAERGA